MIGGTSSVARREPGETKSGAPSNTNNGGDAPAANHNHPHAAPSPLPAPSTPIADGAAAATSRRQLHFPATPATAGSSGLGGTPTRPGPGLGAVPEPRSTRPHASPDPSQPSSAAGGGGGVDRELALLWKALDEERHVVKMKTQVISRIEGELREEKSLRLQLEAERDSLRAQITKMRSGGGRYPGDENAGGVSPSSRAASIAEQNTQLYLKRPVQMHIGFPNYANTQTSIHRRAAAAAGAADGMSSDTRAALANEYLETELQAAVSQLQQMQRTSSFVICDLETSARERLATSCFSELQTIGVLMQREQRFLVDMEEARTRGAVLLDWAGATVECAASAAQDQEAAAVKYFVQASKRLEKELFVNMQDLARAATRTSEHHDQIVGCVANYSQHLENLHYQCVFEIFRGESNLVRWRSALDAAAWHWPRWWSATQELFEASTLEVTNLFALSAKLLLQQESAVRSRAAGHALLQKSGVFSVGTPTSAGGDLGDSTATPFSTPGGAAAAALHHRHQRARTPPAGGGRGLRETPMDLPDNTMFAEGGEEAAEEFVERVRHLEGRLAQKTRLIGLHVKRIQELETENEMMRSGGATAVVPSSNASAMLLAKSHQQQSRFAPTPRGVVDSRSTTPTPSGTATPRHVAAAAASTFSRGGGTSVPNERAMLRLYEDWQEGVRDLVAEMHEELLMLVRPWARVPRALLAQMQSAAAARATTSTTSGEFMPDGSVAVNASSDLAQSLGIGGGGGGGGGSPAQGGGGGKTSKTLYIRGLSRSDVREYSEYETQAMAATLVASPEAAFEAAQQSSANRAMSGTRQAMLNHFYNYVSMTLLDEAREYSVMLLRHHDDMVSAFHRLRPVVRSVDVIKVSLMEGALSLAEAQRDQALTSSHWIHTQAEQAVTTLRELVSKSDAVAAESKTLTVEEAANQARAQAAARRLEEMGAGDSGGGGPGSGASQHAALQEVVNAFDNVAAGQSAMNDPEMLENQRLAEEFATKCNLLVNRASFLYRRLMERERDVDVLSRRLAEVEVRDGETRDSTDASIVVQMLEREIADDALVMLREAMLVERETAQNSIRVLLNECQERNYAIRDLQQQLRVALTSCRYLVGIAQHAEYSWQAMHDSYVEMGKKVLRVQRAQLLPPISEVALQMFVAHFEYCDSLLQSHDNFLDQSREAETNVDALVQRRKVYEREMVDMGQEMFRLNQESRLAKQSVKALEQWAFTFVTESCTFIQGINATAFSSVTQDLVSAYAEIDRMKAMLPKNYVDVSERLDLERFERGAFEERAKLLEQKLTRATTEALESQHNLNETQAVCEKLDRLRSELESNNRELELLLLQEREAAESLREHNMEVTDELTSVRNELATVRRALMTEAEAHNATIRNLSGRRG